jgi:hypothetical protein
MLATSTILGSSLLRKLPIDGLLTTIRKAWPSNIRCKTQIFLLNEPSRPIDRSLKKKVPPVSGTFVFSLW